MKLFLSSILVALTLVVVPSISAQSSWERCSDGKTVTRCETYDCPQGDTNQDGSCTSLDTGARITEARNDSLCGNPTSGCGAVKYYPANTSNACMIRVEETRTNCNLQSFSTPTPISTQSPTPTPTATPTATPVSTGILTCSELLSTPKTGPSPLKVSLEIKTSGSTTDLSEYKFSITDPSGKVSGVVEQKTSKLSQTFSKVGTYTIVGSLIDTTGKEITSNKCTITVQVAQTGSSELPATGSELWVGLGLVAIGALGVFVYEKFRFV